MGQCPDLQVPEAFAVHPGLSAGGEGHLGEGAGLPVGGHQGVTLPGVAAQGGAPGVQEHRLSQGDFPGEGGQGEAEEAEEAEEAGEHGAGRNQRVVPKNMVEFNWKFWTGISRLCRISPRRRLRAFSPISTVGIFRLEMGLGLPA